MVGEREPQSHRKNGILGCTKIPETLEVPWLPSSFPSPSSSSFPSSSFSSPSSSSFPSSSFSSLLFFLLLPLLFLLLVENVLNCAVRAESLFSSSGFGIKAHTIEGGFVCMQGARIQGCCLQSVLHL